MYVKYAVMGALAGAVLLAGGILGWQLLQGASEAAERPQAVAITESAAPTYSSAQDLSVALSTVGCGNFASLGRRVNGETDAGECGINGTVARLSIYPSRAAVGDVLDASSGRDAYGMPLVVVAGENWIVTFPRGSAPAKSAEVAKQVAKELGGAVMSK